MVIVVLVQLCLIHKNYCLPIQDSKSRDKQRLIDIFNSIIKEKNIEFLVIGLPISLKGKETLQTKKVKVFGEFLKKFNKPIFFQDERFSSITAENSLISENIKTGHNKDKLIKGPLQLYCNNA